MQQRPSFMNASLELEATWSLDLAAGWVSSSVPVLMNMATDPSAFPEADPQAPLSLPKVFVDLCITKQRTPLLSMADAPGKEFCNDALLNKGDINLEMAEPVVCVALPEEDCGMRSQTITKPFASKRCKPSLDLQLPAFKLPKLSTTVPANPSPSAPAATLQATASADVSASAGTGATAGSVLSALQGLTADKLPEAGLDGDCHGVCVEAPVVLPAWECSEISRGLGKTTFVPEDLCKQDCLFKPQKSQTSSPSLHTKPPLAVAASLGGVVSYKFGT